MEQLIITILSMLHLGTYSTPVYFLILVLFWYFNHVSSAAAKKKREDENEKKELEMTAGPASSAQMDRRWDLHNLTDAAIKEFERVLPETIAQTEAQPPTRPVGFKKNNSDPEHVSFAGPAQSMQTALEAAEIKQQSEPDIIVPAPPVKTAPLTDQPIGWEAVHIQIEKARPNHAALLSAIALAECLDRPGSPIERLRRRLMYRKN
jgi:hypothetical protein